MGDIRRPTEQDITDGWKVQLTSCQATRWVSHEEWFRTLDQLHLSFEWDERGGEAPPWADIFRHYEITSQMHTERDAMRWIIPSETPEHIAAMAIALIEGNVVLVEKALAWWELRQMIDEQEREAVIDGW